MIYLLLLLFFSIILPMEQNNLITVDLLEKEMSLLDTKPPLQIQCEASQYMTGDPSYDEGMDLLVAYQYYEDVEYARSFIVNRAKEHVLQHWKIVDHFLISNDISPIKDFAAKKELASFILPLLYAELCSFLPNDKDYITSAFDKKTFIFNEKKDKSIEKLLNIVLSFAWMNDYVHDRENMLFQQKIRVSYCYMSFCNIAHFFSSYLSSEENLKAYSVAPLDYIVGREYKYLEKNIWPFFGKSGLIGTNTMLFCMHMKKIPVGIAHDITFREVVHAKQLENLLDLSAHDIIGHPRFYIDNIAQYNMAYENLLKQLIMDYQQNKNTACLSYMRLIFYIVHEITDINKTSFATSSKGFIYYQTPQCEKYYNDTDVYAIRSLSFSLIDLFNTLKVFDQEKADSFMQKEGLYITQDSLLQSNTGNISKTQFNNFSEFIHQWYCDIWHKFKEEYPEEAKQAFPFKE